MPEEFEKNNIEEKRKKEKSDDDYPTPLAEEHIKMQTPEDPGKPVIIKAEAYKTIILYGSRYANKNVPPSEWKEIYGVLIGKSDDDFVHVERAEALTFGHDTDVQLDERHYGFIERIENELYEEGTGDYIVGWFHSHPGLGLFFSYIDLLNQLFFQTHKDGIGIVFDHTLLGKKKQEKIEGTEHTITKYDTGFEVYRITDVTMDINDPNFDTNYHKVTVVDIQGLNKYFFANVLAELSSLVSAGKPLQTAYGENYKLESSYKKSNDINNEFGKRENLMSEIDMKPSDDLLVNIPMAEDVTFNLDRLFYDVDSKKKSQKLDDSKEIAEQLIYEGNLAFNSKDTFTGIEKYRQAIKKYKELNDIDRVLDLLRNVSKICVSNNHLVLAGEFAEELYNLANKRDNLFYTGVANYISGYLFLKKGEKDVLKKGLNSIRDAAILFEKVKDYAGAGMSFNKIGTIYQTRLENYDSACLFYREAIENYNKAIVLSHPLRKSLWSKPELLREKIIELRDLVEELLPNIQNLEIRKKTINDLKAIKYNF